MDQIRKKFHLHSPKKKAHNLTPAASNPLTVQPSTSNPPPPRSIPATNLHAAAIPPAVNPLPPSYTTAVSAVATPTPPPGAPASHQTPTVLVPTQSLVSSPAPAPSVPAPKNAQVSSTQLIPLQFSNPRVYILEKALEELGQEEHAALNINALSSNADADVALSSALKEAKRKQEECNGKPWVCTVGKYKVRVRDVAEKVVKWLDRFKSVLDVAVSADPIHAALPWAAVRVVLEIAATEQRQMAALLSGLNVILFMGHRMLVYYELLVQTSAGQARDNLVKALVRLEVLILRFLAEAILWSEKSLAARSWAAFWKDTDLKTFEARCSKIASDVEVEARGCDRHLADRMSEKLNVLKTVNESINKVAQDLTLSKLPFASGARFDSQKTDENAERECLEDTRVDLLLQIDQWAHDPSGESIFWLNGMAGTGKSTISRTVARRFDNNDQLGASFFFMHGPGERGKADLLFPTIARQLAQNIPEVVESLEEGIRNDFDISGQSFEQQFEKFILQPLRAVPPDSRLVAIVIDALDECEQDKKIPAILRLFARATEVKNVSLRFFLTSRPEARIQHALEESQHRNVVLDDFLNTEHDISKYVRHEVTEIRLKRVKNDMSWPGEESIKELVRMAVPLFICAFTICRFLADEDEPVKRQLEILKTSGLAGKVSQLEQLDIMYTTVFEQLLRGKPGLQRTLKEEFHTLVGTIVVLAKPLSIQALASLLEMDAETISYRLGRLHSVLRIPESNIVPVSLFHLSFADFLLDPEKREDREKNWFSVDQEETHKTIAMRCLKLLLREGSLREDYCDLKEPGVARPEVSRQVVDEHISFEVQYACQYWVYHIKESKGRFCDIQTVLDLLKTHLLHWLEALSWMGRISDGVTMINTLRSLFKKNSELTGFLYDSYRFLLSYRSIAESSPLQLYSVLIFAPETSIVRNTFRDCIPGWISQQPKVELGWNAVLQTLEGHDGPVNSIAFSHDSILLASASDDTTIKIWDTSTGSLQQTLEGHDGSVRAIAFSYDSTLLASGSGDKTVKIWDASTGSLQQTLSGHRYSVNSIAFSHDSTLVASASHDKTVKIWNTRTGSLQQTLEGHNGAVRSVAFSYNSTLLASASHDETVKIWNRSTGSLQQTLRGHHYSVNSIAFSYDSTLLASASDDWIVKIWDTSAGSLQHSLRGHRNSVNSVIFSYDSTLLVSASNDETVKIWDTSTGSLQKTLEDHNGPIRSIAFSYDSTLLASASYDKIVKIWDVSTSSLQTLEGHDSPVNSITFSYDSTLVASVSNSKIVKIWDASTGSLQQTIEDHDDLVNSIAFSYDSKLLASASEYGAVKIWATSTGSLEKILKGHHLLVNSIAFSYDSKLLASASLDETVKIWDASTGLPQQTLEGHESSVDAIAFSYDSTLLASASNEAIKIWDTSTGALQQTLEGLNGWVTSIAFSHDSTLLASVSDDKTVIIWDARTGSIQQTVIVETKIAGLSFDYTDSNLIFASGGSIKVDRSTRPLTRSGRGQSQEGRDKGDHQGLGISGSWVTWNTQNLLWLPPDYRVVSYEISTSRSIVTVGCLSGKVFNIGFSPANLTQKFE